MKAIVRVPSRVWADLRHKLFASTQERFAYLLGRGSRIDDPWGGEQADIYVRRAIVVPDDAMSVQTPVRVEVDEDFTGEILRGCYAQGLSLIDVHTHPFADGRVGFSGHDRQNMAETHVEFHEAMPPSPPAFVGSLVLGQGAAAGAIFDPNHRKVAALDRLVLIGSGLEEVSLCHW